MNISPASGKDIRLMWKLNAAICDDEEFYRNEVVNLLSTYANEMGYDLETDVWENGSSMVEAMKESGKEYDVIFLDVEMPGISGMDAANELRRIGQNTSICFVTAHIGYAYEAYRVDAIAYITKPIKYVDMKKIMEKVVMYSHYRRDKEAAEKRYLNITSDRANVIIDLNKVVYIEKRRNQCVFHCTDREQICYDSLRNIYKKLDPDIFLYIHQGYIASFPHIKEVLPDRVCFGSGMQAPLSRRYYASLKKRHWDKVNRLVMESIQGTEPWKIQKS